MTTGEGGMIVTDRDDVADRARRFIEHGRTDEGFAGLGHTFCLSDVAPAIGRVQLDRLPRANTARREYAERLTDALRDLPVVTPLEPPNRRHVFHIHTIKTGDRDQLRGHLRDPDIRTGVYHDTPIHRQPAYAGYDVTLPVVESSARVGPERGPSDARVPSRVTETERGLLTRFSAEIRPAYR